MDKRGCSPRKTAYSRGADTGSGYLPYYFKRLQVTGKRLYPQYLDDKHSHAAQMIKVLLTRLAIIGMRLVSSKLNAFELNGIQRVFLRKDEN